MNRIDDLTRQTGEWLRGDGPMSDIVISSRIRLARNLMGYPFLPKADESQRRRIYREVSDCIASSTFGKDIFFVDFEETSDLDRLTSDLGPWTLDLVMAFCPSRDRSRSWGNPDRTCYYAALQQI